MKKPRIFSFRKIVVLLISVSLLLQVSIINAAVNQVKISSTASISVNNASLHLDESTQTLYFELSYQNSGTKKLNLLDYWVRVVSTSGTTYSVKVFPEDKSISSVAPKTSQNIKYYTKVGKGLILSNLKVRLIKFDFSVAGYERALGTISLASFTNLTKANQSRLMQLSGMPVYSKVKEYTSEAVTKTDAKDETMKEVVNSVELNFVFFNNGKKAITLPLYKFFYKTKSGLLYPLKITEEDVKDMSVNPKTYKKFDLTTEIPKNISLAGAQLYIVQEMDTGTEKLDIAVANYALVKTFKPPTQTNSKLIEFELNEKKYEITFNQFKKHHWDIQDVANFELNIKNTGTTTSAIPELVGTVSLDEGSAIDLTFVKNKYLTDILPGKTVIVNVLAKIPSDMNYSKAKFTIAETKEKIKDPIGTLDVKLTEKANTVLTVDQAYRTEIDSRNTSYELERTGLYENTYGNLFMAQISVTNNNVNARELSQLVAYFKTSTGLYYKANVSDMKEAQNARSKRMVHVWATIPKTQKMEGVELIIGEGILNGQFAVGGENPDAMINSVTYKLPSTSVVTTTMSGIEISPFTIKVNEFLAVFDQGNETSNQLNIRLKYNMAKDYQFTNDTEDRKIIFSLEYAPGQSTFSQTVDIAQGENSLQLGDNTITLTKTYDKSFNFHLFDQYSLNVYEEFQGHKKLIASKPFIMYFTHDWSNE